MTLSDEIYNRLTSLASPLPANRSIHSDNDGTASRITSPVLTHSRD